MKKPTIRDREPRWPVIVSLLATAGLYAALPSWLSVGPNWLVPVIVLVLLVPSVMGYGSPDDRWVRVHRYAGFINSSVLTFGLSWSLMQLVLALPTHRESAKHLLFSAGALWITNVLVFALWYWRLDAGGPDRP